MSAHTPGPWEVHPNAKTAVHQPKFSCWIPQNEADARLIAAAPDLLEALTWAANNPDDDAYWIAQARAAIAKATGQTP